MLASHTFTHAQPGYITHVCAGVGMPEATQLHAQANANVTSQVLNTCSPHTLSHTNIWDKVRMCVYARSDSATCASECQCSFSGIQYMLASHTLITHAQLRYFTHVCCVDMPKVTQLQFAGECQHNCSGCTHMYARNLNAHVCWCRLVDISYGFFWSPTSNMCAGVD